MRCSQGRCHLQRCRENAQLSRFGQYQMSFEQSILCIHVKYNEHWCTSNLHYILTWCFTCTSSKYRKHCLPAWSNVLCSCKDHLWQTSKHLFKELCMRKLQVILSIKDTYHILDSNIWIVSQYFTERHQEIFLKLEMWQFLLFQKLHRQLT